MPPDQKASQMASIWPRMVPVIINVPRLWTMVAKHAAVAKRELSSDSQGAHPDTTTAWPELMFSLSSPQEERAGERRPLLLKEPLPTRASRGEGENFWWLYQDAPLARPAGKSALRQPEALFSFTRPIGWVGSSVVEQRPFKPLVVGSNPTRPTTSNQ